MISLSTLWVRTGGNEIRVREIAAKVAPLWQQPLSLRMLGQARLSLRRYTFRFKTGDVQNAGTDATVFVSLIGEWGLATQEISIRGTPGPGGNPFERGRLHTHPVDLEYVGDLWKLDIHHDNTGGKPGWFLVYVEVDRAPLIFDGKPIDPPRTWRFPCNEWLAAPELPYDALGYILTQHGEVTPTHQVSRPPHGPGGEPGPGGGPHVPEQQEYWFCVTAPGSGAQPQSIQVLASTPAEAESTLKREHIPGNPAGWSIMPGKCLQDRD